MEGTVLFEVNSIKFSTYLLSAYIVLLPVSTALSGIIGNISFLNYVAIAFIVSSIVETMANGIVLIHNETKPIILYFAYSLLTCLWSQGFSFGFYFTTFATSFLIILATLLRAYSKKELQLLIYAFLLSTITVIGATIINYNNRDNAGRLIITLSSSMDPNDFGCGLCIIIAALLSALAVHKKPLLMVGLVVMAYIIFLTGSRGALLMLLVEIGVWVLLLLKNNKGNAAMVLTITILLTIVFFSILPTDLTSRFSIANVISGGGSGRLDIWKAAINTFSQSSPIHKIFGYGHGSFRTAVNYYGSNRFYTYEAHNMFINALIEGGLIGTFLLLTSFTQALFAAYSNNNNIGLVALSGFMITGLTLDVQSYRLFPLAFVTAFIFSENKYLQNRLLTDEKEK